MDEYQERELLFMMKAMSEENRLALLRMLIKGERSVGDLARQIDLAEPTVSHHLSKLREAGLVNLRMEGTQRFYRADPSGIARFKRLAADVDKIAPPQTPADTDSSWIAGLGWNAEDQKALRDYTIGRRLKQIPTKQKPLLVVLRWLATLFEPERTYSEVEVNETIKKAYERDYVTLRRHLVDYGYLRRERGGGQYWLAPEENGPQEA